MSIGKSGGPVGHAYISVSDTTIDDNGIYYIPLHYHFPVGHGISINPDSALVKPFEKLMLDGKPHGEVAFVFYNENMCYFVLGSFALARRIIFFPGLKFSRISHTSDTKHLKNGEELNIKHITLEPDLSRWHAKLVQHGVKFDTERTKKVNDNTFLWFVMGIRDVNKLEPMPATQDYLLKAPDNIDSDEKAIRELARRKELMQKSIEGNNFPVCDVNDIPTSPYFINFEIFVSTKKSLDLEFDGVPFYIKPPMSNLGPVEGGGISSKSTNDFSPIDSVSIYIRTCKIRGSLKHDAILWW